MKIKTNKISQGWSEKDFKSRIKELKTFENLLLNPFLQDDIKIFRRTHKIPRNGFESLLKMSKWEENYKAPKARVELVEEIYSLGVDDRPIKISDNKFTNAVSTYNLDLSKILTKYDLSLEWFVYIENYIKTNEIVKLNPIEVTLTKLRTENITLVDELSLKFGATMKVEYLTSKFMGNSTWKEMVEPIQKLMQGYKEKGQRPSKAKTKIQSRIYKLATHKRVKDIVNIPNLPAMSPEVISQHLARYKKKILPKA